MLHMQDGICYSFKLRCALNPSGQAQRLDLAHHRQVRRSRKVTQGGEKVQEGPEAEVCGRTVND